MVSPYVQVMHYGSGVFEGIRSYATPDGTEYLSLKNITKDFVFCRKDVFKS